VVLLSRTSAKITREQANTYRDPAPTRSCARRRRNFFNTKIFYTQTLTVGRNPWGELLLFANKKNKAACNSSLLSYREKKQPLSRVYDNKRE